MHERDEGLRDLCDAGVVQRDEPGPSDQSDCQDPQHEGRAVSIAFPGEPLDYRVQRPMRNVFHCDPDTIRHFWGSELLDAPTDGDQELRHVGTLEPLIGPESSRPAGSHRG